MTEPLIDTEVQGAAGASQPDDAAAILDALERHEADAVLSRDGLSYLRAQEVYDRERQAEAALRRSQQRLRLALESAYLISFEWDIKRNEVRRDVSSDPALPPTPEQAPGTLEAVREVVHPDDRELFTANVAAALERPDGRYQSEFRIVHADGQIAWLHEHGLVERDADGQPERLLGVSQDVTDHKLAEEALRRSQQDLQRAQAVGRIGSWRLDVLRDELTWSAETHHIFGVAEGTPMRYESFLECVHPDDRATVDRAWQTALRGAPYDVEHRLLVHGQVKWVRERAELEFDAAGNLRGGFGTTQDISDLKQSEMALRESEARLRQAAQAAHFGIFDGDPIAGTIYWSPELREILGFPADIAAPPLEEIPDLVHPDDAVRMRETCARVLDPAGDGQLDDAFRIRRATGELRWVHLNGRAEFAGEGQERRAVRLSGVMRDVTESHQTQLALQQAKQAADLAAQTKSAFLANMSHEIRTPLSVVIGLAHLLRRDISAPAKVHKLDQLCATSNHLLALLNDILDLSRVHAGRLVLDETDFGLDSVIAQVMRMVESMASAKGLTLTAESTPAVRDLRLRGDPLRLAQVLVNLSGNAVKFTDRGGVRLCVSCIAEQPAAVTLRFAVVDTGCGIAPADQAQLFEPFTQTDSSSTREHGGTGLGLAISQNLLALMGSSIQVRSAPGSGSTFSFEIVVPRATGSVHDAAGAPAAVLTTALDGLHVLFAEDHPQTQMIVLEMLEDLGCEVDLASDGAEAVACARAHAYDLILLDMQMPKMDGVAAARAIRTLPGFAATPIIALTANAFAEDRQRCLDAGMNAHLAKPVTPDTLAAALSPWLPAIAIPSNDTPPCDHPLDLLLAAIPGLHVGRAWRTSPDKLLDYCAQLHRFVSVHADDIGQLRQHLDAGRRSEALLIAHNLAGIASLIGARELASLASDLVRALREDGDASTIQHLAAAGAAAFASLAERISALPERPEDLASG